MKKLMMLIGLVLMIVGCQKAADYSKQPLETDQVEMNETDEVLDASQTIDGQAIGSSESTFDAEAITAKVHTIKREEAYETGRAMVSASTPFDLLDNPQMGSDLMGSWFDDLVLVMDQKDASYSKKIPGLEKTKGYDLALKVTTNQPLSLAIIVTNKDQDKVYFEELVTVDKVLDTSLFFYMAYDTDPDPLVKIVMKQGNQAKIEGLTLQKAKGALYFADEFDVNGLPNPNYWGYETGGSGFGNAELQYYTAENTKNSEIVDGFLYIRAIKEKIGSNPYSSARLKTIGKVDAKYKRIEVRAKLPVGVGTWPAIWMMPTASSYGTWPASGEIDIMEHVGYDPDIIHGTVHTADYNHKKGTHRYGLLYVPKVESTFHDYVIEWSPYQIDFYVDDYLYFTFDHEGTGTGAWPFDKDFYLILCLAIGGQWGGQQGIDPTITQAEMVVDYVRYYDMLLEAPDITSPEKPSNLEANVYGGLVQLSWDPAKDDFLTSYYNLYVDGRKVGQTTSLSQAFYTLEGPVTLAVEAVDLSGNVSGWEEIQVEPTKTNFMSIDSLIEAEDAMVLQGGEVVDKDGVMALDYLDPSDHMIYPIHVSQKGTYTLSLRMSSLMSQGAVDVLIDGERVIEAASLPSLKGWANWEEVTIGQINLEQGNHYLTLTTNKGGFIIDSMTLRP